jgi:hypothetical protein
MDGRCEVGRDRVTIDLGSLGKPLRAHCVAQKQSLTSFVLHALEGALDAKAVKAIGRRAKEGGDRVTLRASITREAFELIQRAQELTGARSLAEFLEAMASQGARIAPRPKGISSELMELFSRSNFEVRAIGKNVNQIAHSLNLYPGKITDQERRTLSLLPQQLTDHVVLVSRTLLELRPPRKLTKGIRP